MTSLTASYLWGTALVLYGLVFGNQIQRGKFMELPTVNYVMALACVTDVVALEN
jgi:hypothetical protein